MSSPVTPFPDAHEEMMGSQLRATLGDLRGALLSVRPSHVRVADTWTRRDMGGYDFVMPHQSLIGFSLVARVPDAGDRISLTYSECRRRDRGDEFDAAFGVERAATVETVARCETFFDAITKALIEYVQRDLREVRYIDGNGEVVATEIFWPDERDEAPLLLWHERRGGRSLRNTTPVEAIAAFDEGESADA